MQWITNSKLFKGNKRQELILAAVQAPINKNLVQQLKSYVDPEFIEDSDEDIEKESKNSDTNPENNEKSSKASGNHTSKSFGSPASFSSHSSSEGEFENLDLESDEVDLGEDNTPEDTELPEDDSTDVEESTQLNPNSSKSITATSYVTVDKVSQAVNEIPGLLNLRDDTNGVTYAALKGTSSSEVWVYYNLDVDLNKVLDRINLVLNEAGYYFLEFNRVSRDDHAVIFVVNWVSNYFNPLQLRDIEDEKE